MSARGFSKVFGMGLALALAACGQACSDMDSGATADSQKDLVVNNGLQLNGTQFNGLQLNGLQLNGLQLNGLQLNGLQLNGLQLNGLQLNGLQLNGLQLNGTSFSAYAASDSSQVLSGTDLVGMMFDMTVTDGSSQAQLLVRVDGMTADTMSGANDVFLYDLSYKDASTGSWKSVCTDGSGSAVRALPIANYWNMTTGARVDSPGAITFACINGALGKCVRWGYRPWATSSYCGSGGCSTVSLQDYHQACTRMVRADYCGNGVGHTVDGTPIDVFDNLSPQIQSRATDLKIEAKWTPSGATCLGKTREEVLYPNDKYPDCNGNGKSDDFPSCSGSRDYTLPSPNLLGSSYSD